MKAFEINGALYVFESEATAIEPATSVQSILIQQENLEAFKEANATAVAAIMQPYNYNVITSGPKVWSGHTDDDYPIEEPTEEPTEAPTENPVEPDPVEPDPVDPDPEEP